MTETPKDKDQEKGDEVLRRMFKTPPDHKAGKSENEASPKDDDKMPRRRLVLLVVEGIVVTL